MAQALLNNLNTLSRVDSNEHAAKNDVFKQISNPNDFEKVLDEKTEFSTNNNSSEKINQLIHNKEITKNAEAIKETISEIISDTVQDIAGETALEGVISAIGIVEEILPATENEEIGNNITADSSNAIATETIINEDPTVRNEDLIYPSQQDNLTAILLNTPIINKIQNENPDNEQGKEVSVKFNNKELEIAFKNLDLKQSEDNEINLINYIREDEEISESDSHQKNFLDEKIIDELKIETLENQSSESGDAGNLMKQSPQEQVIKAIIHGDIKFDDSAIQEFVSTQEITKQDISSAKIVEQITKQLESMYNSSKVNIILNPERLGKVSLQIINGKDGLSAQFTVTTNEARELLMKGLDGLKESLLAHGVNVNNVNIKLNESEKSSYNPDWTEQEGSNQQNKQGHPQKQKDDKKHFEQMMFELNKGDKV